MEIWKDVKDYEGRYKISNLGRAKSLKREEINTKGELRRYNEKVLKGIKNSCGYICINTYIKNTIKTQLVHRLVAQEFISNPENKPQVNHINGVKTDNRVENLEWVTPKENVLHARSIGLNHNIGETHGRSKLTEKEVLEIRKLKITEKIIAEKYNISTSAVGDIRRGEKWRHI